MRNFLVVISLLALFGCHAEPAFARYHSGHYARSAPERHHRFARAHRATYTAYHHRWRTGTHSSRHRWASRGSPGSLVTVGTTAGPITVASGMAPKFIGFFQDLRAQLGYVPRRVGCYARGGHISHSMHYTGEACDVDQTARNRTSGIMYHISEIAHRWGLTDGCSFHDCGHISNGR